MHKLENITLLSALGTLTQIWSDTETKVNRKKKSEAHADKHGQHEAGAHVT